MSNKRVNARAPIHDHRAIRLVDQGEWGPCFPVALDGKGFGM